MMEQKNYENSPFHKSFNGTKHGNAITYNPQKEFGELLKQFIKDKFDEDITISGALDSMIKDYFFRYAYKNKGYYEKTIIATTYEHEIEFIMEDENHVPIDQENFNKYHDLTIVTVGVLDRYAKSKFDNELIDNETIDNYELVGALIHDKRYVDVDLTTKKFIDNQDSDFFHYANIGYDPFKKYDEDVIVLELSLNNNLDANINGFYCYENDDGSPNEQLHVGVNIANIDSLDFHLDAFPIIYYWYLDENFNVKIKDIFKISNADLEKLLYRYSDNSEIMYSVLSSLIEIGTGYELRLKEEIKHNQELHRKMHDSDKRIERLKKAIEIENKSSD